MAASPSRKQVNMRVDAAIYRSLLSIARQDRRSVPQAARLLLEDALRLRIGGSSAGDDASGMDIGPLAVAGEAFDWLMDEPDLYDDSHGEPV